MRAFGAFLIGAGLVAGAAGLMGSRAAPHVDGAAAVLPAHPMRVMSLNQCTDQLVLALLPPERITSVTWLSRDDLTSRMAAEAMRVPANFGQAEEVLAQDPDLIVTGAYTTGALKGLLKRLGYPILEVETPESFAAIGDVTRKVADALGERAKAEAWIVSMDRALANAAASPTHLRVAAWDGGGYAPGEGTLYNAILVAAGAINVASEAGVSSYAEFDAEALIETAPDVLVQGIARRDEPGRRQDISRHPLERHFYEGRTVTVPQSLYVCGTPYSAEAVSVLHDSFAAMKAKGYDTPPFQVRR
jgi:iron complex transport system substrate-binding protein